MNKRLISLITGILLASLLISLSRSPVVQANPSLALNELGFIPGQPGTTYRYARSFGETRVPYLADTDHLYTPMGIEVDESGNLWVAEGSGARALEFTDSGTNLLSIGTAGLNDIAGDYNFAYPTDIAVDSAGNFWVVDMHADRVVKYDTTGIFQSQLGFTWEEGSDANHFDSPRGAAFDSGGFLYVSDTGNNRIRIFDLTSTFSMTLGGPGNGDYEFNYPMHLTIDMSDTLYVTDMLNHRVQIYAPDHTYLHTLGETGNPGNSNNQFNAPYGVAVDPLYIYVADSLNCRIQIFELQTFLYHGTLGGCGSGDYEFNRPLDVASGGTGVLYVADTLNHRVQKFINFGFYSRTFGVTSVPYLTDGYHFNLPSKVAIDTDGNLGIVEDDGRGHRFIKLDVDGDPIFTLGVAGVSGDDHSHFNNPGGIAFDSNQNIYVGDCDNHRIEIFHSNGTYSSTLGSYGQGEVEFNCPNGLTFDSDGNLYVADYGNYRVQIFTNELIYSDTIGITGEWGSDNDHFAGPRDVAVDQDRNVYVTDLLNHRVQVFDRSITYLYTLGMTGECGNDFAHFCYPSAVAAGSDGKIYVADRAGSRVQVFDPSGAYLTTIGGSGGEINGQIRIAAGVEVDHQGNVYVADLLNYRVQKFVPGYPGWSQVNINGFGNINQQIESLEGFKGYLYASNTNWVEQTGQVYRSQDGTDWEEIDQDFNAWGVISLTEFQNQLFAGVWSQESGGLWSTSDGLSWTKVMTASVNTMVITPFKDALFATFGCSESEGNSIWKTTDGVEWQPFVTNGNGDPDACNIVSATEFNDNLYWQVQDRYGEGQIWRTNGISVTTVITDDTDLPGEGWLSGLGAFNDWLYAGISNGNIHQLWRSASGEPGTWAMVLEIGQGELGWKTSLGLVLHGPYLIVTAEVIDGNGMQIWRTTDGLVWDRLVAEGFGNSFNFYTQNSDSLEVFQGQLWVGAINFTHGSQIWRYDDYTMLTSLDLTHKPNQSFAGEVVTFTASLAHTGEITPTGVVTFTEGITVLGSVPIDENGDVMFSTSELEIGEHLITAAYSGDEAYLGSISESVTQTVVAWKAYLPVLQR